MLLPVPVPERFRIIAHRGASAYAPENTRRSFQLALDMGAKEIETDMQLTLDGRVALCHDTTLERFGYGPELVEQKTADELTERDMGQWFSPFLYGGERMLLLDELFDTFGSQFTYHLELKGTSPDLPAAVAAVINAFGLRDNCVVTSFSYELLHRMRKADNEVRLGWLIQSLDQHSLQKAADLQLFQLCPNAETVTPLAVRRAKNVVAEVRAWGLGGQRREAVNKILKVIQAGCDGMTIDWPDWLSHSTDGPNDSESPV